MAVDNFVGTRFPRSAPLTSQVVLDSKGDCNENPNCSLNVGFFRWCQWYALLVGAAKERPGQVADRGQDDSEIIAPFPESVVRCLVAKDQHETDDDRQRWDLEKESSQPPVGSPL